MRKQTSPKPAATVEHVWNFCRFAGEAHQKGNNAERDRMMSRAEEQMARMRGANKASAEWMIAQTKAEFEKTPEPCTA